MLHLKELRVSESTSSNWKSWRDGLGNTHGVFAKSVQAIVNKRDGVRSFAEECKKERGSSAEGIESCDLAPLRRAGRKGAGRRMEIEGGGADWGRRQRPEPYGKIARNWPFVY